MQHRFASVQHRARHDTSDYRSAGQGLVEYSLILVILIVIIIILVPTLFSYPAIAENGLTLVVVGGVIASIAWTVKQTVAAETNHVQLRILELLSQGEPLSRQAIKTLLARERRILRLLPEISTDALAELVRQDKVAIAEDQKYTLAQGSSREP